MLSIFRIVPTYLTTFCWPIRLTIRLTPLLSSSAHVLILVILILFNPDLVSVFIFVFYLQDRTYLSNNFLLARKAHDSTNSLAQQFCSRSYPGNSSSFLPRHCFIVYNCFLSLGSTYLSNNSLLAEKTHDSTNSLAQQFCSRSYPGNSSSLQPRHCFIVYNCFLSLGSTYLSNNSLLAEKAHDPSNYLAQHFCSRSYPGHSYSLQPRHGFCVYICFLSFGSYLLI